MAYTYPNIERGLTRAYEFPLSTLFIISYANRTAITTG